MSVTPVWRSPCGVHVKAAATRRRSVTRYSACLRATNALVSISHITETAEQREIKILLISRSYDALLLRIVLSSAASLWSPVQPMGPAWICSQKCFCTFWQHFCSSQTPWSYFQTAFKWRSCKEITKGGQTCCIHTLLSNHNSAPGLWGLGSPPFLCSPLAHTYLVKISSSWHNPCY